MRDLVGRLVLACSVWRARRTPHDVLVDLDAESERDDVCDAWTAIAGITLLQFDEGRDEFPRGPLGPGFV